jgi:hypothetical protein
LRIPVNSTAAAHNLKPFQRPKAAKGKENLSNFRKNSYSSSNSSVAIYEHDSCEAAECEEGDAEAGDNVGDGIEVK